MSRYKSITTVLLALSIVSSVQAKTKIPNEAKAAPRGTVDEQVAHVLNRLTFGPRPGDVEKVKSLGIEGFIDAQLNPTSIAEPPDLDSLVKDTPALHASSKELLKEFHMFKQEQKAVKKERLNREKNLDQERLASADSMQEQDKNDVSMEEAQQPEGKRRKAGGPPNPANEIETEVIEVKLARAIDSPRQLNELLADFWFNHFNVCMQKGVDKVLVGAYEEQAIRPHVLGKFRDLVGATMHHPAMMFYLDNAQNTKPGFQERNPKNKRKGINENYARELLELHTLGVDGGYTQKDVMELARVLTGWGMPNGRLANAQDGFSAVFEERRHDFGDKTVLGQTIKGTGEKEIEQVLDMLAKHPSTAHHVTYKLAQYFVDDQPPETLVKTLETTYLKSDGDIKKVLSTLFSSREFWDTKYRGSKFKSPFHYTVSAYRATGMRRYQPRQIQQFLKSQGQPIYGCLTPDGYKTTKEAWLNPDGLIKRLEFASRLNRAQRRDSVDYQVILRTISGGKLSDKTKTAIEQAPEQQKVAAIIGSPEFMKY
ncbi:MAG: DUF1800 domain-containing protein [Cyanobacteria bacterium]|nr:DUF1800 domain-containing protein [Cyanobacteriota bacterium]